jgi:hypothetical protein
VSQKRKNILITVTTFLVIIVGFGIWFTWTGSTKEIESIANQFKPDGFWTMKEASVTPPRNVCIDSVCPKVSKRWTIDRDVTGSDLDKMIKQANFKFSATGECDANSGGMSSYILCKGHGDYNDYNIEVYTVRDSNKQNYTELILLIDKQR